MISASILQVEAQHCVWHGECDESVLVKGKKYNCNYTGPPVPLQPDGYELLKVHAGLSRIILPFYFTPFYLSNVLRLLFACRSFVLDMTTGIEASAVMLTSCVPLKKVSRFPFSSFLGMLSVSKLVNEAHDNAACQEIAFWMPAHKVLPVPKEWDKGWDLTKLTRLKITQSISLLHSLLLPTIDYIISKIYNICKSCGALSFVI